MSFFAFDKRLSDLEAYTSPDREFWQIAVPPVCLSEKEWYFLVAKQLCLARGWSERCYLCDYPKPEDSETCYSCKALIASDDSF